MSYMVKKNSDNKFDVLEKDTNTLIELSITSEKETRGICRKLNLGSGFDGFTPLFLANAIILNSTRK